MVGLRGGEVGRAVGLTWAIASLIANIPMVPIATVAITNAVNTIEQQKRDERAAPEKYGVTTSPNGIKPASAS
jgi:hypothetical protein